jgi:sporulation protein YlmC with PRC-barrel domain
MSVSEASQFTMGSEVACSDGVCGELTRVIVDPIAGSITHLIVDPKHGHGIGRLVPIELAASAGGEVRVNATRSEFDALEAAEEAQFLPATAGRWGYEPGEMLEQPYLGLMQQHVQQAPLHAPVIYDRVPAGEVEVRRGQHVQATDGEIGHVRGLVIDPADRHVTHVLLEEGHLWGKKRIAIPISAVADVKDGVRLTLTKGQVEALPPVVLDSPE